MTVSSYQVYQWLFVGFNATLESEIEQVGDEVFGILRNLDNLTAGEQDSESILYRKLAKFLIRWFGSDVENHHIISSRSIWARHSYAPVSTHQCWCLLRHNDCLVSTHVCILSTSSSCVHAQAHTAWNFRVATFKDSSHRPSNMVTVTSYGLSYCPSYWLWGAIFLKFPEASCYTV